MKNILVISFSLLLLFLSFKDVLHYAHFYLNQTDIIEKLCINKNKPELKCKGKCHLKKIIEKEQKQEQKLPNPTEENKSNIVYFSDFDSSFQKMMDQDKLEKVWSYEYLYSFLFHNRVFHPPKDAFFIS